MKPARWLLALFLIFTFGSSEAGLRLHGFTGIAAFVKQLLIGGGGWTTRCMTGTNGYRRCRTDTYGGFEFNPGTGTWSQILVQSKMPAANFGYVPASGTGQVNQGGGGVYSMAVSPSGTTIYFVWGKSVYVSTNNGVSYTLSGTIGTHTNDANGGFRQEGPKLAIDPNNPDHVIAGTDQDGLFETLNGTAGGGATWTSISPATIPTAVNYSPTCGGAVCYPSYNIIFDPASAHNCRSGAISTCTVYVFAYTESAGSPNGKVWKSTDGLATVAATTSGPTTIGDMNIGLTGGVLWATDMAAGISETGGDLWKYNGAWTHVTGSVAAVWRCGPTSGADTCHSIAFNPSSALKMAVSRGDGSINYSADGGSTWTGVLAKTQSSPTIPWMTAGNFAASTAYMANGNISYDPSLTDTLLQGAGLGPWTTSTTGLTGGSTVAWTSSMVGTEQLVAVSGTAPNGVFVVGNQDKSSFYLGTPNSYPSDGNNTYSDIFGLAVTWDIDYAAGNKNFLAQLNTPSALNAGDNSGTSSDGGQNWKPYTKTGAFGAANGYVSVDGTAVSNCGTLSNHPIFTVPSTSGLTTWSAGAGTLMKIVSTNLQNKTFMPITVLSGTTFRVDGDLDCNNYGTTSATKYNLLVSTNPQSDFNGSLYITNVTNNGGGLTRLTFANGVSAAQERGLLCVSGVGGVTTAGCWESVNVTNNSADLFGSTFSGTYTVGTGIATTEIPQGGYLAVASSSNITEWPSGDDHPVCTADGGQTWSEIAMGTGATAQPLPSRVTNAVWAATGNGQITFTTSVATGIKVGEAFNSLALTASGYNFAGAGTNLTAISGTTGTTVVGVRTDGGVIANPGAYTASTGIIQPLTTGWGFSYFTFRHTGVADRIAANTFYSYNYLRGIYKHVNCAAGDIVSGTNLAGAGAPSATTDLFTNSHFASSLKSVPGTSELLFTSGLNSGSQPGGEQLLRSTDGGVSWQAISRVATPIKMDCGAIAPTSDHSTCYFTGWYDTTGAGNWVYSLWRTTGTAAQWASGTGTGTSLTWTNEIGATASDVGYPLGSSDVPQAVIANGTIWNEWAIGFGGSGWTYGLQN